jgi:hypothetical protein
MVREKEAFEKDSCASSKRPTDTSSNDLDSVILIRPDDPFNSLNL